MKQSLILLLFLLFSFQSFIIAQESSDGKRVGIGIVVSPELNSSALIKETMPDRSIQPKIGFSAGAEMNATFGDHFVLRAGLGYGYKQFGYTIENLIFPSSINPQNGYSDPSTARYDIAFHELQIPVSFHYKFSIPLFIGGGIEFLFPFKAPSYLTIDEIPSEGHFKTSHNFDNPANMALSLIVGYRLKLKDSFGLLLEPVFRHYLKSHTLTNGHFYSIGLKTTFWIGGR